MKQMRRYWFLGVIVILALLFAGMTFAAEKRSQHPSKDNAQQRLENAKKHGFDSMLPELNIRDFKGTDMFERPAFEQIRNHFKKAGKNTESLCDPGYYWMGGETWTSDTDGNAVVWGAGGNLYFSSASDPTNALEMWWGDIPLRIRIHNGMAYVFSYFYTYVFDVSDPVNPSFLAYAPGFYYALNDAIPTPDDNYLIFTDLFWGDGYVWNIANWELTWIFSSPIGGFYIPMYIPEDSVSKGEVLIVGDYGLSYYDFWLIDDLACSPPAFIGQIFNATTAYPGGAYDTGNILYKYPYLYGNYEPWQYYNGWIGPYFFGPSWDDACWVSVYHLPDVHNPDNHYHIKEYEDIYDVVSMKDAQTVTPQGLPGTDIVIANLQGRVWHAEAQLSNLIAAGYFGLPWDFMTDRMIFDAGYNSQVGGVAANGVRGARFFGTDLVETAHYWTGGYANGVIGSGDWIFVPSGGGGVAILDNSDPTWPVTASFVETDACFDAVWYAAVSPDGNYLFVSDGTPNVWTVNVTDKYHPVVMNCGTPYVTDNALDVYSMTFAGDYLVIGTSGELELVDVTYPQSPSLLDFRTLSGTCWSVKTFEHPAYPDQVFIGAVSPDTYYTYRFTGGVFTDTGDTGAIFANLFDLAIVNDIAYVIDDTATIYPISMISQSPAIHFNLSTAGTTPLTIGWSWAPMPTYVTKVTDSFLAASGDHTAGGYPAVFLVSIASPLAPVLLPAGQSGMYPFDMLTGLTTFGGMVYYATDYFGIGAFTLEPDYDMPMVVDPPGIGVSPIYYNSGGLLYIQKTVNLSVSVTDDTSAITRVRFEFWDGSAWRRIVEKTNSTPAGQVGTYTYAWDTTKWAYGVGNGPIRVQVEDSGCNVTYFQTPDLYHINTLPWYDIVWAAGCNDMPLGGLCNPASAWVVCGNLCFTIWGYTNPLNIVSDGSPDDVSQIAYAIDGGAWTLVDIPTDGPNPLPVCIDTTLLADGSHTLTVRITDDCTLQGFEDSFGRSSFTFLVDNDGPQGTITAPMAGDLVRGADIRVAAKMHNEMAARPVSLVRWYLDSTDTTTPAQIIATGTYIGQSTTKDENGEFSFLWDATAVPYGDHILVAVIWEDDVCSCGPYRTPLVSFNLVSYAAMTVSVTAAPTSGQAPLATVFTANVVGGQAPYTYTWTLGDGGTGSGQVLSHSYTAAGSYTATCTVSDNTGATASGSVVITVTAPACTPPTVTQVTKGTNPFRLKVYGTGFQPGCVVKINGTPAPYATTWKNSGFVVAKRGAALKALCPKGVTVQVTVTNPDGCVSASFPYTR